jgi:ADP-glucose pyrophosphorylase
MIKMEIALQTTKPTKKFNDFTAVDNLNITIERGEVFGLLGPNGAGKTTTLRIVSTLLLPTSGTVKVFGLDVVRDAGEVRRIITYLPEEAGAYRNLSGWEYLEFMAKFRTENKKETKYWKDIGLIDTYWEANMDLVSVSPLFNLYDQDWPVRTYQKQLPPVKTVFADGERMGVVLNSIIIVIQSFNIIFFISVIAKEAYSSVVLFTAP